MKDRWVLYSDSAVLDTTAVNLWRFRVDQKVLDDTVLSEDERARTQRLQDRSKANAFASTRSKVRHILGLSLGLPPSQIPFEYSLHGKPFLKGRPLFFNVSHSGEWGLCAVSWHHDLGVDLERLDPDIDMMLVAKKFFSMREQERLQAVPDHRRRRTFFRLWTRNEAILKAHGQGLSAALFSTTACRHPWLISSFPVAKGYLGALAVKGDVETILRWEFSG